MRKGEDFWLFLLAALFAGSLLIPAPTHAAETKPFDVSALEYNINASPQIHGRKFSCKVKAFEEGIVKVIEISSFLSGKSDPDVIIKIVASSNSVGSVIYNGKKEVIAEYPKGEIVNNNLYLFKGGDEKKRISGKWYIDPDYLMSDFSITDEKGMELYKETVVYLAKNPSRK